MRLVVDLQGAQSVSSTRGIGRYVMGLARAIADSRGDRDVVFLLNDQFPDRAAFVIDELKDVVPRSAIRVWSSAQGSGAIGGTRWLNARSNEVRGAVLDELRPDVLLDCSVFEGFADGAITGVPSRRFGSAAILYDLIPLLFPDRYLVEPQAAEWYRRKVSELQQYDLLLAISDGSRNEAMTLLDIPPDRVVTIGGGVDPMFAPRDVSIDSRRMIAEQFGVVRPFALYVGGFDSRKNLDSLVEAWSLLADADRRQFQLVVACKVDPYWFGLVDALARDLGIGQDEIRFTDYVSDETLVDLYNLCSAMVMPSLHEGLGFPILEAMACGKAVIASNTSSMPELVGRSDALFDPNEPADIARVLSRVMNDAAFRSELELDGPTRAEMYTWERTAARALEALTRVAVGGGGFKHTLDSASRPSLALVSPVPPAATGIADYVAVLAPALGSHFDVTVISDQPSSGVLAPCRTPEWFVQNAGEFDRIVYQFGNSPAHSWMFPLLGRFPGVVVLHDLFLSGVLAHMELSGDSPGAFREALAQSHGLPAVALWDSGNDLDSVIRSHPANVAMLRNATGVIVHSEVTKRLVEQWTQPGMTNGWEVVALPRSVSSLPLRAQARAALGLDDAELLVCSFGAVADTKMSDRVLEAWSRLTSGGFDSGQLVFVGQVVPGDFGDRFDQRLRSIGRAEAPGRVERNLYETYLAAADVAVQLRAGDGGETSAALLDCLGAGVATVANVHGTVADIPEGCLVRLADRFTDAQLDESLAQLLDDPALRNRVGGLGREYVARHHDPATAARGYRDALERLIEHPVNRRFGIAARISTAVSRPITTDEHMYELRNIAQSIAASFPPSPRPRQLLVDVSELARTDIGTGIQRVTRNVVRQFLAQEIPGVRVELVAAAADTPYHYVRKYAASTVGIEPIGPDGPIDVYPGDVLLVLDFQTGIVVGQHSDLRRIRARGASVHFAVYDLLPIELPRCFHPGADELQHKWIQFVLECDGAWAISRSVAEAVESYRASFVPESTTSIGWFPLGSEMDGAGPPPDPSMGLDEEESTSALLARARPDVRRTTVLMVGTVEARKANDVVLDAVEALWAQGVDLDFVIIGKRGWLTERLSRRIHNHDEIEGRLWWLSSCDDTELAHWYEAADCLVVASRGEGYGLPIVEGLRAGTPVLARDLPVFREVGGDAIRYFTSDDPETLSAAILDVLDNPPPKVDITLHTWADSAQRLLELVGILQPPEGEN